MQLRHQFYQNDVYALPYPNTYNYNFELIQIYINMYIKNGTLLSLIRPRF